VLFNDSGATYPAAIANYCGDDNSQWLSLVKNELRKLNLLGLRVVLNVN
jgi:hypothetical protein